MTIPIFFSNKKFQTAVRLLCAIMIVLLISISFVVYRAPIIPVLVLLAFFIFYIQLPGMLVLKSLCIDSGYRTTSIVLSALIGWLLAIGEYFLADATNMHSLLYFIGPLLSVFYIYKTVREGNDRQKLLSDLKSARFPLAFYIFIVIVVFHCLLCVQYLYLSPDLDNLIYVNPDKAFHMGLANSLARDYPIQSIWFKGAYFYYHIFTEILYSLPIRLFDIRADICFESFGPLLTAYIFGLSFFTFFREMSSKPERASLYCLIFLLSNPFFARSLDEGSIALKFLLTNDNASGFAVSAALMFIVFFDKWNKEMTRGTSKHYSYLAVCVMLIMLTTGLKGPIGALIVASLFGSLMFGLILRKLPVKMIVYIMIITAAFVLIYTTVLGAKGQVDSPGGASIEFAEITDLSFWKEPLVSMLVSCGIPKLLRMGIVMAVFMLFFITVFFVPFCIGYNRELILVVSGRKEYDIARVLVYAECIVGIVAMFVLSYSGHSQTYFGLITIALAPIVSFWFIEDLEKLSDSSKTAKIVLRTTLFIMAATIIITTSMLAMYYNRRAGLAATNTDPDKPHDKYCSVSHGEYEAMMWLRNNTAEDALISTDRYYSTPLDNYSCTNKWDNRFFLYEVFSNRFSYFSASGYILHKEDKAEILKRIEQDGVLYDENNPARGRLARDIGIDYLIVSKRFSGNKALANEDYELCFSNEDADIYKIKK